MRIPDRKRAERASGGGPQEHPRLLQSVGLILQRPKTLCATFLLVFCGLAARSLLCEPVYTAFATLQVEDDRGGGGLLGDLQALRGGSTAAAEMEIMRSARVATGAFRKLDPGEFLVRENEYLPARLLLEHFRHGDGPVRVRVRTSPVAEGGQDESYLFSFGPSRGTWAADGGELRVERRRDAPWRSGEDKEDAETLDRVRSGIPFVAFGREFLFLVEGDPAGIRFQLALRSPSSGAIWIQEHTSVLEVGKLTNIARIAFEAETPGLARAVAAALAESYLDLKVQHQREQARAALDFLRTKTLDVSERLHKAEGDLDRFRAESGAVLLSDRAQWLVQRISSLEVEKAERGVLLGELQRLKPSGGADGDAAALLGAGAFGEIDPLARALVEQLARLELDREAMSGMGLRPSHPDVLRIDSELRAARTRLRGRLEGQLGARIGETERDIAQIDRMIGDLREEARELPEAERTQTELAREMTANLQIYTFLVQKEQEAQIALASTLGSARLIDAPMEPRERTSPKLTLHLLAACLLACALAAMLVLLIERLDRSVRSAAELERWTELPLYGSIPAYGSVGRAARRLRPEELVAQALPRSALAESYRALRTNLRFARMERQLRAIAVTSSAAGEGKTVTSCNLAVVCAQLGERVILVDADLRRPAIHRSFGMDRAPGLRDVLRGGCAWREALRQSEVAGLQLLSAGDGEEDPAILLGSAAFASLLTELREEFDWVIVDVPPVLAVSDSAPFLGSLDGVLLLARHRVATCVAIEESLGLLERLGVNTVGAIYNGFDARRGSAAYRNYGRYYSDEGESVRPGESRVSGRANREKTHA